MMDTNTRSAAVASPFARTRRIGLWGLQSVYAAFFIMSGGSKLAGAPDMITLFDTIGAGQWLRLLTGGIETAAGVMLLIPILSGVGAVALAAVMAGATLTHIFVLQQSPIFPLTLLAIAGLLAWIRRDRIATLVKAASPAPE